MKPSGPVIKAADCRVETIPLTTLQELIKNHHYARGCAKTATFRHGLFWKGELVGGALWIPPTRHAAHACFPKNWRAVISLSRLVVVQGVPKNAASLLLSRSVKLIKRDHRWEYAVTYADTWQGHVGTIYKASNWDFLGMTVPERLYVDNEGVMRGRKRGDKTYTHQQMLDMGFSCLGRFPKYRYGLLLRK